MPPSYTVFGRTGRSLTGAWIETIRLCLAPALGAVAPLRGRGLKLRASIQDADDRGRRSLTGAWIETAAQPEGTGNESVAPLRGRGLKPKRPNSENKRTSRSLTGAWIETFFERWR